MSNNGSVKLCPRLAPPKRGSITRDLLSFCVNYDKNYYRVVLTDQQNNL